MNDLVNPKKTRKMKIPQAHKDKKKNYSFANRKRIILNPTWILKPVIWINTEKRFNSLKEAAEEVYKNKNIYNYISDVCKGTKPHYKKHIWIFEKDFILLSECEKQNLRNKCSELNKTYIKYRTKLYFEGHIYDSYSDLGEQLFKENLLSYRNNTREDLSKLLSTLVGAAKKKHCPFIMLKDKYIFWAEYEIICKDFRGAFKLSERPVSKDVKEIYQFYNDRLNNTIGDITISELLQSTKDTFYKFGGLYFKSESNIKKYAYDKIIYKATMLSLLTDSSYILLCNKSYDDLVISTKNKFYLKDKYILLSKNDYIDKFVFALTKEDVLKELNLLV